VNLKKKQFATQAKHEIAADGPVTGKNAEEGVAASGFRNRLLGIPFTSAGGGLSSSFSRSYLVFRWP